MTDNPNTIPSFMDWVVAAKKAQAQEVPEAPAAEAPEAATDSLAEESVPAEPEPETEDGEIVIDGTRDADWMHSLPGYRDEVAITEQVLAEHKRKLAAGEVDKYGNPIPK